MVNTNKAELEFLHSILAQGQMLFAQTNFKETFDQTAAQLFDVKPDRAKLTFGKPRK